MRRPFYSRERPYRGGDAEGMSSVPYPPLPYLVAGDPFDLEGSCVHTLTEGVTGLAEGTRI